LSTYLFLGTEWAEVVYPLLQRGAVELDGPALCEALRTFLRTFTPAYVLADYRFLVLWST